jgi:uncharacterized protein (DUF2062 family)
MTSMECPKEKELRFKRIRRLKRWMRPLPRRSNIHNYPVLKWFADSAYKRSYLWSFKGSSIRPALFWGVIISLSPLVGIQMLIAFFVAFLSRANLPLMVAIQWISNPFTMGPIYYADYKIGRILLELTGFKTSNNKLLSKSYDWSNFEFKDLLKLLDTFPPMFVGGAVLGVFFGVISVFVYNLLAKLYKSPEVPSNLN